MNVKVVYVYFDSLFAVELLFLMFHQPGGNRVATSENVPSDMCTERNVPSKDSMRMLIRIFTGHIFDIQVFIVSSCGQRRL